jgi:hypothetical protein
MSWWSSETWRGTTTRAAVVPAGSRKSFGHHFLLLQAAAPRTHEEITFRHPCQKKVSRVHSCAEPAPSVVEQWSGLTVEGRLDAAKEGAECAELERSLILERVRAGPARAMASRVRLAKFIVIAHSRRSAGGRTVGPGRLYL